MGINDTYLDKTENASDPEDSDYPEKRRADGEVGEHILKKDTHDWCEDEDEVKKIPWHRKIMMA